MGKKVFQVKGYGQGHIGSLFNHNKKYKIGIEIFICLGLCWFTWFWLVVPAVAKKPKAPLNKIPVTFGAAMENTPFLSGDRPFLALNYRDDTKNNTDGYKSSMYLFIRDLCTGQSDNSIRYIP